MAEALAPVYLPKKPDSKTRPSKFRKVPRSVMEALAKKGAASEAANLARGIQPAPVKADSDE